MGEDRGISEAFVAAMEAIATVITERPFPKGLNKAELGDWALTVNTTGEPLCPDGSTVAIPGFNILVEHKVYFVIGLIAPDGGIIGGGMEESEFIAQMRSFAPPAPATGEGVPA